MTNPDNTHSDDNPVGRFMVACGAVIENESTGKILLLKRSDQLDWKPGEWEIDYGRIAQFESPEEGLKREVEEETSITKLTVVALLRANHIFRGEKKPENDLIILTHYCTTPETDVGISDEHSDFGWFDPIEAKEKVAVQGVKDDIQAYIDYKKNSS